ncbi:MAG: hypothetical protein IPP69_05610 [Flavobacteriales bacterium]|nr:hypothetical protein [Flavobacteriales bacterium]
MIYLIELIRNGADLTMEYDNWMKKANVYMAAGDLVQALRGFRIAHAIKPAEETPIELIAIINGKINPPEIPVVASVLDSIEIFSFNPIEIDSMDGIRLDPFQPKLIVDYGPNVRFIDSLKWAYLKMIEQFNQQGMELIGERSDQIEEMKKRYWQPAVMVRK